MATTAICNGVLAFNKLEVIHAVERALEAGVQIEQILNNGLIQAMEKLGDGFERGEFFVPEMLLGSLTMKAGLDVLKPHIQKSNIQSRGTIVIGTVKGDQHDVGKNLVAMMLVGRGFEVIDIGVNQTKEKFLAAAEKHKAGIVGLSSLLTTCMPAMQETVRYLKQNNSNLKILVGGAPITQKFAMNIGADGYGKNGPEAVRLARSLAAAGGERRGSNEKLAEVNA